MNDKTGTPASAVGSGVEGEPASVPVRPLLRDRGFKPGDDRSRVEAYQGRFQMPLDLLALISLWFVVVPPGVITSDHHIEVLLLALRAALSITYAIDITIRTRLAPHHWFYLRHNLLSVATVFIPFLRVTFSLRLLRSVFQRGAIGRFVLAAGLMFVNLTIIVYFFERQAPNGNIKTFGNAAWWAVVTVTTVGYGDYTPVTWEGRVAAVILMAVGFTVLATLTAQIASSFIDQAARVRARESGSVAAEAGRQDAQLQAIAAQLNRLEQQMRGSSPPPSSNPT
ncbi:MAG: potassium channel family protein [Acidimicrobiales bacterium]